jgi:CelD/BcsL family acetyltransferase involved in cellulose biosynthesis
MSQPSSVRGLDRPPLKLISSRERDVIETTGGSISTHVVEDLPSLQKLEGGWKALFKTGVGASFPLNFAWTREWWRYFGTPRKKLAIITVYRGEELIGVLPLYREQRPQKREELSFISLSATSEDSFYPEYNEVLTAPGMEEIVAGEVEATLRELARTAPIQFGLCRSPGILVNRIAPQLKAPGRFILTSPHAAPVADLTGGFERYLERLSANTRQQMRRLLRSFHGTKETRFELAQNPMSRAEFLKELISLHQARWRQVGEPGAFSTPERIAFHCAVVARLGEEAVLTRLSAGGRSVTLLYGFQFGSRFEFYQSGNDPGNGAIKRSGIVAHLLTMQALAERGIETYDFLEGAAPYKLQLSTGALPMAALSVSPMTAALLLKRSWGAVKKLIPPRFLPPSAG